MALMIRAAELPDIPAMLEMVQAFHAMNGYGAVFGQIDEDDVTVVLTNAINGNETCAFVIDADKKLEGLIVAVAIPVYFNSKVKMVAELIWWVNPEYRNKKHSISLLRRMEDWAASIGANLVSMICLENVEPEKVGNIYERMGYSLSEHSYIKVT